jgi:hypothetical protein
MLSGRVCFSSLPVPVFRSWLWRLCPYVYCHVFLTSTSTQLPCSGLPGMLYKTLAHHTKINGSVTCHAGMEGGWSTPRYDHFIPGIYCTGNRVGLRASPKECGKEKNLLHPLKFEPRIVQPVASRSTKRYIPRRVGYIPHCWQLFQHTSTQ